MMVGGVCNSNHVHIIAIIMQVLSWCMHTMCMQGCTIRMYVRSSGKGIGDLKHKALLQLHRYTDMHTNTRACVHTDNTHTHTHTAPQAKGGGGSTGISCDV